MPVDPYVYPGISVLKNKLGIRDKAALDQAENDLSSIRIAQLVDSPIKGRFDYDHLKAIHRHIFQDVYEWAGETRTVDMGKSEAVLGGLSVNCPSPTSPFPPENLSARAEHAFDQLARDNRLQKLDPETFAKRLTKHAAEIWEVHPFREGNTRATTVFVRQLAQEAGYPLTGELSRTPRELRDAFVHAAVGEPSGLELAIKSAMAPTLGRLVLNAQHARSTGKSPLTLEPGVTQKGVLAAKLDIPGGSVYAVFETQREFTLVPWRDTWARNIGRPVSFGLNAQGVPFARGLSRGLSR